jgi:hypothetical protein
MAGSRMMEIRMEGINMARINKAGFIWQEIT